MKLDTSVEANVRRTYEALVQMIYHEHTSLMLVQHCDGMAAPALLFGALNYRNFSLKSISRVQDGIEMLGDWKRTHYSGLLSLNSFSRKISLSAPTNESVAQGTREYMHFTLKELFDAV